MTTYARWYTSGTVAATNGSTTITGTSTVFVDNVFAGDTLLIKSGANTGGLFEVGADATTNTSLTLAESFGGTTAASLSYAVIPTSIKRGLAANVAAQVVDLKSKLAQFYFGSTAPDNDLGADGSIYWRTGADEFYEKASGAWGSAITFTGTTHVSRTDNPHSVTAAQVGAYTTAQVDALVRVNIAPDVIIQHQTPGGTSGGDFTAGSYQTRPLTTVLRNVDTVAALASNQITLGAGDYYVEWESAAFDCDAHKSQLFDTTGASILAMGSAEFAENSYSGHTMSHGCGVFTLSIASVLELQHRCQATKTVQGFGVDSTFGDTNVFATVKIWVL